jgi:hypothetical protein
VRARGCGCDRLIHARSLVVLNWRAALQCSSHHLSAKRYLYVWADGIYKALKIGAVCCSI